MAGFVPDRSPEQGYRASLGQRKIDGEQRDRDGDHRIGEQGQPIRRARLGLGFDLVIGHPPIIPCSRTPGSKINNRREPRQAAQPPAPRQPPPSARQTAAQPSVRHETGI